jgi:type II secretory pathway pseudopilin PulG
MWKGSKSNQEGFLFVELAFVLMIVGIVLGSAISLFRTQNQVQRAKITHENQRVVLDMLQEYLAQNGRLPCPADLLASPESRGERRMGCTQIKGSHIGIVPYRTLGLPESVARDGYGQWMTYAVDPEMTGHLQTIRTFLCRDLFKKPPQIDIQDGDTPSLNKFLRGGQQLKRNDGVAIVLISHGSKGWGALQNNGKRTHTPDGVSLCKKLNCQDSLLFCASPSTRDKGGFGDHVQWRTRSQMVRGAHIHCFDTLFPAAPDPTLKEQIR